MQLQLNFSAPPQGTIYGWTDGKRIYLTREGMNPETPVHEYTHLGARAMMQNNAEGWLSIKDLLRDTPMWNEVLNDVNYANIRGNEDAIASEVLSRLSGKNGAQKMQEMAQRLINEGNPDAQTLIDRIRQALQDFWHWVGVNLFDIQEFESIDEITDRVLWDMVQGTDLGMLESGGVEFMGSRVEKRRAEIAEHFNGQQLSGNSLSIVNAFAYGSKNEVIEVIGKRIVLKQGNENKAGVSHSLMRHYGTSTSNYSADELLLIPQVIEQGERKQEGAKISYKLDIDGVKYTVTTEMRRGPEEFTNFYTNRRPIAESLFNTDEQHGTTSVSVSADEVTNNSSPTQENDELFRPEDNQPFYSNAEYAVRNIKQDKATPQQWLAMIQKNGGLKAGEDKWLGLSDWLKGSEAKTLTKQEVLDYIADNQIVVEEVRYSQFGTEFIDEATRKLEAELNEVGWEEMENRYPGFGEYFEMYGNELVWSEERASIGEYEDFILDNRILTPNTQDNAINETRERYTTEGLENKKEIALVVPSIEPYNQSDEIHFGDAGGGRAVAWVRFGETADADGNRVLVIDEIQSKRHQDGREKGYRGEENYEFIDDGVITELRYNGRSYFFESSLPRESMLNSVRYEAGLTNKDGVPDAPFDKNWHELAMKRMLRYAAENGFDKVAWTTGTQQAERYNIGGEGMKGFYDKMLPSFMNKYGKKWGVQVGEVSMPNLQEGYQTMHSIDVTPQMRESVMQGQPMFRPEEDAADTADTFTSVAEATAQQLGIEVEIDEGMPAKGSYNPRTGRIRINPSRHATAEDVRRTVLHETIGHGGVQAVMGDKFNEMCNMAYDLMSEEQRADFRSRHGNLSNEALGAEYIAEMAEKGEYNLTAWEKIKGFVRNYMLKLGFANLTDADIRYMLYSASKLAEKGKLQDAINRATTLANLRKQAELSHDIAEDAMSRPLMRPVDPDLEGLTTGELGITDVQLMDVKAVEEMLKNTKLAKANSIGLGTLFSTIVTDRTLPIAKFVQQVFGYSSITKAYTHDPENNPHIWANLAPSKAMRRAEVFRQTLQKDLFRTFHLMAAEWRSNNQGFSADYATAIARLYAVAKTAQERQAIKGKGLNDVDYAGVTGVRRCLLESAVLRVSLIIVSY